MPRDINKAPSWQPDAIPTKRGWVHPKTGELLISTKNIDSSLYEQKTPEKKQAKKKIAKKTQVKKKKTSKKNVKK